MSFAMWRMELARLLSERRVWWAAGLLVTLFVTVFAADWQAARRSSAEAAKTTAAERARWLGQDPKNPHSAAHYGVWVFKPSPPLAVLDRGIEPFVGRMVRIEAHRRNDAVFRSAQDSASQGLFGGGVAGMMHVLLPLMLMLLGYSAFAADRERGTLRLALGNGTAPGRLLLARYGALLSLATLLIGLPLLILGCIAIATLPTFGWSAWTRLLSWLGAEFVYAAVFLLIAMVVSLCAKTARSALVISLAIWALACIVVPRAVVTSVEAAAPTPLYSETLARVDAELKRYNRADLHHDREQAILKRFNAANAAELPIDLRGAMMHDREQHDYAVFDREIGTFLQKLDMQDRLYQWAAIVSPMIAVDAISEGFAGTDQRRHNDFLGVAERYRRTLSDAMNLDLVDHPAHGGQPYLADETVWGKVPAFAYRPASLMTSIDEIGIPLLALAGWLGLTGLGSFVAVRRMRP